jgi:hypothetical protein
VHHVLVGDVRVGEDGLVDLALTDDVRELGLRPDRNPLRIELSRERGGVDAALDVGDLRGREGDDVELGPATVDEVEVMEVPPGGAQDDDASSVHARAPKPPAGRPVVSDGRPSKARSA